MNKRKKILIVDEEPSTHDFFQILFKRMSSERAGFFVDMNAVKDGLSALQLIQQQSFDMLIADLNVSKLSGLELLKKTKQLNPELIFLMLGGRDKAEGAVLALKCGAYDYVSKPFSVDKIKQVIFKAFGLAEEEKSKVNLKTQKTSQSPALIGRSEGIKKIIEDVQKIAGSMANVLITGESGSGKEVVARFVHSCSLLKDQVFVPVNCGAIPADLMESEMFGHKKGSFTGAVADKKGFFEAAEGGTLFLDEVGELSLSLQPKLLRVLQEKTIKMVGSVEDKKVNVRLISATNRDLESKVQEGSFREDLFYRLNVINIHLPPLRERKEDISLLVQHFVEKYCNKHKLAVKKISNHVMKKLQSYDYPGNIRELENLIERMIVLGEDSEFIELSPSCLPVRSKDKALKITLPDEGCDMEKIIGDLEKDLLNQALNKTGGVKTLSARMLGLNLRSFRYRLKKYRMDDDKQED